MADNYLLLKGASGETVKVKLKDLQDGTFALKTETDLSAGGGLLTESAFDIKQDLKVSELRDALRGASDKTLSDLATALAALATAAKQDVLAGLIGAKDDTAVTDYTLDASEIALLKGILAQMQGDGTGAIPAILAGSIPEYNWFAGEERPEPAEPSRPAIGVEVDAETGDMVGLLWNGEDWGEV